MTRMLRFAAVAAIAAAVPLAAAGVDVQIKLATQAPSNSIWHNGLTDLGAKWQKDTAGRVGLTVYADGSQGAEAASISKMRLHTLQGGLLTAGGLSFIDKAFDVFTIPFLFENDKEEMAVQKALAPDLEAALKAKGFHLVCWGTGGWVQIFSKKPLKTLADLKASNLYASKDDDEMIQWYTRNGFRPKGLTLADIAPQLKLPNGMIDTTPDTPYLALVTQIFTTAKYMLNVHIAPLVGAMVVTTDAWQKISPEDQAKITADAEAMEADIRLQAPKQDDSSVEQMKKRGLEVITPDAKAAEEFRRAAADLGATMRGTMVPAAIYDKAKQVIDQVRK